MCNRLILLLLLCASGVAAQIPSITTNSKLRFVEGNTIFDRSVGDIFSTIDVDLTTGVTGTLPVANGGTGATTFTAGRLLFGNGTSAIATDGNLTWTDASDLLSLTGSAQISIPSSVTATKDGLRLAGTATSATNNVIVYGIRNTATTTNTGTPTGNALFGFYTDNSVSGSTALTNYSGTGSVVYNSSPNVSQLYGVYGVATEASATGNLSNRAALRFDMNKVVNSGDTHTGQGLAINVNDNSATGRWSTGYGFNIAVSNALTNYGGRISQSNYRGTGNTQYGLDISQSTTTAGVVTDNVYGINLAHSEASSGVITNYYAIRSTSTPVATTTYGLYFSAAGWRNFLNGGLSLGVDDATNGRLVVQGAGATSGSNTALFENSSGTDILTIRDDGMSAFGTTPVSTERLTVRGSTSDNTAKALVAERSSGTDLFGVQNDGKVSINNAAYTEELTINGQAQMDGVILTNVPTSTTASGHIVYNNGSGGTYSGYLTVGDGTRQLAIMPTMIERHILDWAVDWTTGRKGAFWTVPARFAGWKIAKAYIEVTSVGSGAGDDVVAIEIGGVTEGEQYVTAGTHTLVMDDVVAQDDVITFNITAISATPAKGLHISLELSKN